MVIHSKRHVQAEWARAGDWDRCRLWVHTTALLCAPLYDFKSQRTKDPEIQVGDGRATSPHLLCRSLSPFSMQFHKHLKIFHVPTKNYIVTLGICVGVSPRAPCSFSVMVLFLPCLFQVNSL